MAGQYRKKKSKKALVLFLVLVLISVYFYQNVKGETGYPCQLKLLSQNESEYLFRLNSEYGYKEKVSKIEKIIIAVNIDSKTDFLSESPLKNFCFYPSVSYDKELIDDKLYVYQNYAYREIIRLEDSFYIKNDEIYKENYSLNDKVGEIKNGKAKFTKAIYKKENSKTQREVILESIKDIVAKSEKINSENLVSFLFSNGEFTEFMKVSELSENYLEYLILNKGNGNLTNIKDKINTLTKNMDKNEISLIFYGFHFDMNSNEFNFIAMVNILSPKDIRKEEKSVSEIGNECFITLGKEYIETELSFILERIYKDSLICFEIELKDEILPQNLKSSKGEISFVEKTIRLKVLPFEKEVDFSFSLADLEENKIAELFTVGRIKNSCNKEIGNINLILSVEEAIETCAGTAELIDSGNTET